MKSGMGGEPMKVRCFGLRTTGEVLVRYLSWTGLVVFIASYNKRLKMTREGLVVEYSYLVHCRMENLNGSTISPLAGSSSLREGR